MLKTRLIPVLLLQNGLLVRAERFSRFQIIGNPIVEVQRYNEWAVDELIYLDITRDGAYQQNRQDTKHVDLDDPLKILEAVSSNCFMPLTWGGRLRTLDDMADRFAHGADKISVNTAALERPELITDASREFGAQAVVVSIDARPGASGQYEVVADRGTQPTGRDPIEWAREAEDRGAGEILLQNIDHDGMAGGYDLELIRRAASAVAIPIISCSGAGDYQHYVEGVRAGASAVAAANLFHFKEMADLMGKRALSRANIAVRM